MDGVRLFARTNVGNQLVEGIIHAVMGRDDVYLPAPTRLYVKPILAALEKFTIKGMAHITGGGITENVPRILPENTVAQIDAKAWELPKLFQWLQQAGNVETQEMYRTFNCGIGMVVVIAEEDADAVQAFLTEQGETVYRLGKIRERNGDEHQTQVA